jgi:serine/tyrosine/threonine adenylyltransferase
LLGLIDADRDRAVAIATERIEKFPALFTGCWLDIFRRKIGLVSSEDGDVDLIQGLLDAMQMARADFTLTFRKLSEGEEMPELAGWSARWRERLTRDPQSLEDRRALMRGVNPAFIPRNHLVEEMIAAAVERGDYRPFEDLLTVLSRPYKDQPDAARYAKPPEPNEQVYRTFCGT